MKDECLICKAPLLYLDPAEKAGIISQGQSSLSIRWRKNVPKNWELIPEIWKKRL
jgi:hypothetical protein